ncbi:MAG: gliding motility-associated C-terminal domain-containing protein [Cyclobacteriaceae bacterium]|nr:gliding motility-associated C-terminal domain-containing protein [Cyclobacteriaceae bacterium]
MKRVIHRLLLMLLFGAALTQYAFATHLRSAEIQVERVGCTGFTFKITVIVYLDARSNTKFGGTNLDDGHINFGDGTFIIIPTINATLRPDLGKDMAIASFTTFHTYVNPGVYKINYFERDRSSGVMNIFNPGDTAYSSSFTITVSDDFGCNHFPKLSIPPVDRTCPGVKFFHNPGASDEDGDSLSYALTIPARDANNAVFGYISPDDPRYYVNYNSGNEERNGPPSFRIDPVTGLITWDAPGNQGEYNIAFQILEWRKNELTGEVTLLSTTVRDMQILVEDCINQRPNLTIPKDLCVVAGTVITAKILGIDPENDRVKIEAVSEIFNLPVDKFPATYSPAGINFVPSDPPAETDFQWNTNCIHVREQAYQVVFKISDEPKFGTPLVTFKTWNIKVIAPQPVWTTTSLDLVNRYAALAWEPYGCQNAESIQVWRKVDSFPFQPSECQSGIPRFLGYQLIAELNPSTTTYTDTNNGKGLVVGASYCYRLVASFRAPAGGKSYVSTEVCLGPIRADAPVITHVTVEETSHDVGAIRVSWRSPFNIDAAQFPRPYRYVIYRGDGFTSETNLINVGQVVNDTTFVDQNINTQEKIYNYRIVIYAQPQNSTQIVPIDTSAIASSVWLAAIPGKKKIELNWNAEVPWSNVVASSPWHYIYRGVFGMAEEELVLIDSVNVSENGFTYTDEGQFQNTPLDDASFYCYRIMTRGTYGNPAIALLRNFSPVVCLYPENNLQPCAPSVIVNQTDCDTYLQQENCTQANYANALEWSPTITTGCRQDIVSYNVYASNAQEGTYSLIASGITETTFAETGLSSFARCYRVTAVDALGQESDSSEVVCNDNCPNFELPNVFTPNDDGCNDTLSAYTIIGNADCPSTNLIRCPRFVNAVNFKAYNRWGKEVYRYQSGNGNAISIDWDGRDNNGTVLESGIYYYVADVSFNTIDPTKSKKKIKGWVQIKW